MEKKHTITDKQLAFLEDYIKRKKRYFDVESRLELTDHLICDFEENGNGNISQFLAEKSIFIANYKNSKAEKIHWAYQRELWKVFLGFFINFRTIPIVFLTSLLMYFTIENFSDLVFKRLLMVLIIIPMFYGLVKTYHSKKSIRKLIEFDQLVNLYCLPSLLVYTFTFLKDFWFSNKWLLLVYSILVIALNFSALLVILRKRKRILKNYNHLLE